ncbi:MAG: glycosyltransferase family 4 protein, partial [Anaerolineales bacterium]|nr:glycosyltransferase family 4 protein [Anaerolineales bacterium]
PYEGILAARPAAATPLLISVWGNDFTLHASGNPLLAAATRRALAAANGLHTDTQIDLQRAGAWGFDTAKPALVLPGNGGVRVDIFGPAAKPPQGLRVVNPRGIRAYVRNDVFFQAIPGVLAAMPNVHFDCPGMQGEAEAERWVSRLGLEERVHLLPHLSPAQLAETYRAAQVMASPSTHDGTPNSLLEAMACGLLPVCGDLPSIREWIEPGRNGLLVDPADPDALAAALLHALQDEPLRRGAAAHNRELIATRADYAANMPRAAKFYEEIIRVRS